VITQAPDQYGRKLATPVALFEALCCSSPTVMSAERRSICTALAGELKQAFDRFDNPQSQAWRAKDEQRTGLVECVFRAYAAIGDTARLDRFVARVLADATRYDLHAVLIPAVKSLAAELAADAWARPAWDRLHDQGLTELRSRTATKPEPPQDWTRDATIACRCADCRELVAFLRHPDEQVHRYVPPTTPKRY
jgi:hypothetical protein